MMKIRYICDCCEELIKEVDVKGPGDDEALAALTGEEREDIIKMDFSDGSSTVISLCDECAEELGRMESLFARSVPLWN